MNLPKLIHPEFNENELKARKVSLIAFFDTARKRKDGTSTVKLQILHNRQKKLYSTGFNMSKDDYVKLCAHKPNAELREKRKFIFGYLRRAYDIILELDRFSFDEFDKKYNSRRKNSNILTYFKSYIELLSDEERFSSASSYTGAMNKLIAFKGANTKCIYFSDINVSFLKKFEKWMIGNGASVSTVGIYCRNIRTLFNQAIRNGDTSRDNYPFGSHSHGLYPIPQTRNIKKSLSLADLKKLTEYLPENDQEAFYLDMWLFSYMGNGMNPRDMLRLRNLNVIDADTIYFHRSKTANSNRRSKPIVIKLLERSKAILAKHRSISIDDNDYLFPILTGDESPEVEHKRIKQFVKQMNKYMDRIRLKLGIEQKITSIFARHSFATVSKRSGVGTDYIAESLGHSNLQTTESYLDSFEDETRIENTKKLLDFD
ncbi:site-specific integrase [uncultured Draconibacterium sp.]|uniref:tyrosine-type recombinase/integrase n=1 Tax=uncultured Draconibacterium sp. TaxID=1573823 RepID=UPI00325FFB32